VDGGRKNLNCSESSDAKKLSQTLALQGLANPK
jgi:hypothetical protein